MIKLLIDGKEVRLAADISLEFYDRNPFFTSEGQHTLDIDISLDDPQNAAIYNAMHRIDVAQRPQNRQAVLYCEKGVIISGTEIILEIDERSAKIQIVSGNSELNYIVGGDCYLHDLPLGTVENLTEETARQSLYSRYPSCDYVCAPVVAKAKIYGVGCNELASSSTIYNEIDETPQATAAVIKPGTTLCPQPYLAAIVSRVITALGYTRGADAIADNAELSRLFIVHGYQTTSYAEMLENWTVSDFLSEVEHLCGVCLVVDNNDRRIDILKLADYYKSAVCEHISKDDVIGDINKQYDQDPPDNLVYHNVSYKFPDTKIYKFYALDPDFARRIEYVNCLDKAQTQPYGSYYYNLYNIWYQITGGNNLDVQGDPPQTVKDAYHQMKAYYDCSLYTEDAPMPIKRIPLPFPFVVRSINPSDTCLAMVNQFGPRVDETADDRMELRIVPAEMVFSRLHDYYSYTMPLIENGTGDVGTTLDTDEDKGVTERLMGGESETNAKDNLYVAFYLGVSQYNVNGETRDDKHPVVPVTINSRLQMRVRRDAVRVYKFWEHQEVMYVNADGCFDLSINSPKGMYNTYWRLPSDLDLTAVYVIRFRSLQRREARHIFNIANRKFYCQQLKYEVINGRLSDIVEGTFYPLK